MNILAFAGSNSSTSINKELVKFAIENFSSNKDKITLLDLNNYSMPIFSVDEEKKGFPLEAYQFLKQIKDSDLIICSLAEHNRSYTAVFKNILDWASRIEVEVFQKKPMFLMTTSPGGFGGGNVMAEAQKFFPQFGAKILDTFSLPKFYENFDLEKGITNPELLKEIEEKLKQLKSLINDGNKTV